MNFDEYFTRILHSHLHSWIVSELIQECNATTLTIPHYTPTIPHCTDTLDLFGINYEK